MGIPAGCGSKRRPVAWQVPHNIPLVTWTRWGRKRPHPSRPWQNGVPDLRPGRTGDRRGGPRRTSCFVRRTSGFSPPSPSSRSVRAHGDVRSACGRAQPSTTSSASSSSASCGMYAAHTCRGCACSMTTSSSGPPGPLAAPRSTPRWAGSMSSGFREISGVPLEHGHGHRLPRPEEVACSSGATL